MRKTLKVAWLFFALLLLNGCMYPSGELAKNQIPYEEQLKSVQAAVESFQKDNGGILPIKTKEAETPIYEKYVIDFSRISPRYLQEPPGNAFENGGVFQYVLIDVETKPTVKLLDLRVADQIRDIKMRIRANGYPPYKEKLADNVYTINFSSLGYKEPPHVVSPYTQQNLSFVVSGNAEVYVDYRSDLYQVLKKSTRKFKEGEDIRLVLMDESMFVPGYSLPYTIDNNGEPVFLKKQ
ncbi:hypothetical protein D1B31_09930 [Neobacillus notoginsengisoli]|uniref:DUF3939 domain-containing protein n=1 Tax=Neobacillus notoginsengisoli TaxID=1578198 RepID=A0A417YVE0_9BACI|nr:hypothetical protein [Neobacillus notoginsengisoli]RHW41240.1 hypothetical protein D1B31_09930 [Neobacillus notoginsengisoli]